MHADLLSSQSARVEALTPWPQLRARPSSPAVVEVPGAATGLMITTWGDDAFERVVLGDRTVTLSDIALPDPTAPDAAAPLAALLDAVEDHVGPAPGMRTQLLLRWPSADTATIGLLTAAGLAVDAHWCTRPASDGELPARDAAVHIRSAVASDAPAITALLTEEVRFHVPLTPFTRDLPVTAGYVERLFADPDPATVLLVATSDDPGGRVHAYALCRVADSDSGLRPPGRSGHLHSVGVSADARGRGVGGALVRAAGRALVDAGATTLTVAFVPENPLAAPFWRARGFHPAWHYLAAVLPRNRS